MRFITYCWSCLDCVIFTLVSFEQQRQVERTYVSIAVKSAHGFKDEVKNGKNLIDFGLMLQCINYAHLVYAYTIWMTNWHTTIVTRNDKKSYLRLIGCICIICWQNFLFKKYLMKKKNDEASKQTKTNYDHKKRGQWLNIILWYNYQN